MVPLPSAGVADAVYSDIAHGPVTAELADDIQTRFPETCDSIERWIRAAAVVHDWRRVERFANLGAVLGAPGLGSVIVDLLETNPPGLNQEDLVDILGEIRAVDAASTIFRVVERSLNSDGPAYWLCQKAILSLSELDTDEAKSYLIQMTDDSWPNVVRWNAAVALGIEDELGFDEESMLA